MPTFREVEISDEGLISMQFSKVMMKPVQPDFPAIMELTVFSEEGYSFKGKYYEFMNKNTNLTQEVEDSSPLRSLEFRWSVTKFTDLSLELQIKFVNQQ